MPRTNVWLNEDQVDELRASLGKGVNISGCIRAGLALLLDHLGRDRGGRLRREVEVIAELDAAIEQAREQLSELGKAKAALRRAAK